MTHEIEVKVLDVDTEKIIQKIQHLGAKRVLETRMVVDWYGPKNLTHAGDDPWYLRVRTFGGDRSEMSWKSLASHVGKTRQSKEINFNVSDPAQAGELLLALDLEQYAHQEKDRISFKFENWNFDLDKYPDMPAYLEIEGESESHVMQAISLLDLQNHTAISEGERKLISEQYKLNWNDMRF